MLWNEAGEWLDYGWIYEPMLRVASRYGLAGEISTSLALEDVCAAVMRPALVIASVNPHHVRGERLDEPLQPGGHLVVVVGFETSAGACEAVICHNPSGTSAELCEAAPIPVEVFRRAFAGRGVVLWPEPA